MEAILFSILIGLLLCFLLFISYEFTLTYVNNMSISPIMKVLLGIFVFLTAVPLLIPSALGKKICSFFNFSETLRDKKNYEEIDIFKFGPFNVSEEDYDYAKRYTENYKKEFEELTKNGHNMEMDLSDIYRAVLHGIEYRNKK